MTKPNGYDIGDMVFLVNGPVRLGRAAGEYRIVGRLPDADGQAQYRVQSIIENFERRIVAVEIDVERSPGHHQASQATVAISGERAWLKPASMKVHK
jgi:hypothetical protein